MIVVFLREEIELFQVLEVFVAFFVAPGFSLLPPRHTRTFPGRESRSGGHGVGGDVDDVNNDDNAVDNDDDKGKIRTKRLARGIGIVDRFRDCMIIYSFDRDNVTKEMPEEVDKWNTTHFFKHTFYIK